MSAGAVRLPPTTDLDGPAEVAELVRRFYADVAQDSLLAPLFHDVAHVEWAEHLPKLTAFWCRILFVQSGYEGNPLRAHQMVHAQSPFTPAHFLRWLQLFEDTLDVGWRGPVAERARAFARRVAEAHCRQLTGQTVGDAQHGGPPTLVI